jgi:hypothetical protein
MRRASHVSSVAAGTALASVLIVGCGGMPTQSAGLTTPGETPVTILTTSTANDQLSKFNLNLQSISLTNSNGEAVTLLAAPLDAEFIHANGTAEPLATVNVPQGVYTSATVSIGGALFSCVSFDSSTGNIVENELAYGQTLPSEVTVSLPTPITITGNAKGLLLDLLASQSASYASCDGGANDTFSITPTFNLIPIDFSAQPTSSADGKAMGLLGTIASVDASGVGFSVNAIGTYFDETPANGPVWQVAIDENTVYQDIAGPSQLSVGMPVDMDGTVQADGSLLATRIAVYDTNTTNLTVSSGPLLYKDEYEPMMTSFGVEGQGPVSGLNASDYDFDNAIFHVSGQLANLQDLPFAASFTAENMVAGQNVFLSTHALSVPGSFPYTQATTITLRPQTLNGTVSAIGSEGGFTTYTITLAPYDLFPDLAVQPGQTTVLTDRNTVVVYADSSTQMLNTQPIAVGSVVRFYGLVFNDNGTLRMDCAQVNDGVPE